MESLHPIGTSGVYSTLTLGCAAQTDYRSPEWSGRNVSGPGRWRNNWRGGELPHPQRSDSAIHAGVSVFWQECGLEWKGPKIQSMQGKRGEHEAAGPHHGRAPRRNPRCPRHSAGPDVRFEGPWERRQRQRKGWSRLPYSSCETRSKRRWKLVTSPRPSAFPIPMAERLQHAGC